MTVFRNVSLAPVTVASANIIELAPGATIDLAAVVDGLPLLTRARIESDCNLRQAVDDGRLVVVVDGQDQSTEQSLQALTSSSELALDQRAPAFSSGNVVLVAGVEVTLMTWPIASSNRRSVVMAELTVDAPDAARPVGGVYTGQAYAGRKGAAAAVMLGSSVTKADNIPGDRITFDTDGNDMRLRFRAAVSGAVRWSIHYTTVERAAP